MKMEAISSRPVAAFPVPVDRTRSVTGFALPLAILLLLAAMPWCLSALGLDYYLGFARRILIVALAAVSLDLLVGSAGLVALGHAGFMGVGAYALAVFFEAGVTSAWLLWLGAFVVAGAFSLVMGAVALRTRDVYFIMITLAFGQMLYYLAVTLRGYGGDDGYNLQQKPLLGFGLSTEHDTVFYWVVVAVVALGWLLVRWVTASPFGKVLVAARDNDARTTALGYPVYRTRLLAFTLAGAIAGLAGALMLTHNGFVSPANMHWSSSAILLVMLAVGGVGRTWGPLVGVSIWMIAEEWLRNATDYWHWPLGLLLIAVALVAPRGVTALRLALRSSSRGTGAKDGQP
jgi:branched-chain amino acid transport system permease protein